ncbi:MAG: aminoglycoside 6-adenylyltransferase [Eubacteriales bacterium]|nr:aminoglycoside 6-adenylyltransferase [Eubacteriales bacterium]
MRTEQEMMDLILGVAKGDERIRAVLMNGSKANPNVPKDIYQDFDVAYMVTDIDSFTKDHSWIDVFGNRLMLQMPETMRYPDNPDGHFGYLMLFEDGNRIDLSLVPLCTENLEQYDCLTVTLLDKVGIVPDYPPPTDKDFWLKEPDELFYYSCCNNFWWCLNNAAKGIARDELSYVMNMLNDVVRTELHDMIGYYIGTQHGFNLSVGKNGKYFKRYLSPELYSQYAATYSGSDYNDVWKAIYAMCNLFHMLALSVAAHFGFTYRQNEEDGMKAYLRMVKENVL